MDRLFNDIRQHEHHGFGLFFGEALILQALDELEGVEMVVTEQVGGGGEGLLRKDAESEAEGIGSLPDGCGG